MNTAQRFEGADHLPAARVARTAGVGAEFTQPREPADDYPAQEREHELEEMHQEVLHKVIPAALVIARAHGLRNREGQDARKKHHEGIDDALDQRHRYHIAIGDVRDFMGEHAFQFAAAHRLQETTGHRDQRAGAAGPGGKGVDLR